MTGELISAQQARSCSSSCCPGTVVGLRKVDATRLTVRSTEWYCMSRLEPSRNTRRTWTWMFFQYHLTLLPANQIKGTRSQSQSIDALGSPRIALCKKKCEIGRAPADEHLDDGWHMDDIGRQPPDIILQLFLYIYYISLTALHLM